MKRCDPCPNPYDICSCILHPDYKRKKTGPMLIYNLSKIIKETAEANGMDASRLLSKDRRQAVSRVRHIAIKRCREETTATLMEIAKAFNRNHSTIVYVVNSWTKKRKGN